MRSALDRQHERLLRGGGVLLAFYAQHIAHRNAT